MNIKSLFSIPEGGKAFLSPWVIGFNLLLTVVIISALFVFFFSSQIYDWNAVWEYRQLFINGWLTTLWLSAISLILSLAIGLVTALLRRSHILIVRYIAAAYIEIIRGTPLLVQILFFFYVAATALGIDNRYAVGILTLSMFSGAYIAEIIRAGIEGVGKSQLESAKAIGFTRWQSYRFVILPQALRRSLPPLAGQFASLIKDSSLLSIIGIAELTNSAQQVNSATYSTIESFFPLALGYLMLTLPISFLSRYLESRFRYET